MESKDSWNWLQTASDGELDEFAAELFEELPPDDPVIGEVRYWLYLVRNALRDGGASGSSQPG